MAYIDAGVYIVTDTVYIPPGTRIVGEGLASVIMATGPKFQDVENPRQVIQVGRPGQVGRIEWSDTLISTRGACAGAVLIEFNLFSNDIPSGMWDVHTRIGGFPGTNLQLANCPAIPGDNSINVDCIAAFMSMRITVEAGGLITENCWFWVADHDLEDQKYRRITIFAGRGLLVESRRGGIWLSATGSEHHVLYQYQLVGTQDIYIGHMQTETPYFQPLPLARYPFPAVRQLRDPDFSLLCRNDPAGDNCEMAWALRIFGSSNIAIYGAGLYSFFDLYSDKCAAKDSGRDCQTRLLSVKGAMEGVEIIGLSTVGTTVMAQQNGVDTVPAWPNNNTFADSLALYEP
jgi:glucan 1,3-beta-glucosidase